MRDDKHPRFFFILGTGYSRDIFSIDPLNLEGLRRWLNAYKVCKIFRKTFKARQNATSYGTEGVVVFPWEYIWRLSYRQQGAILHFHWYKSQAELLHKP